MTLREQDKIRARSKVQIEVSAGRMARAGLQLCADCGMPSTGYHHEDYSRPLDVIPLCNDCHSARHKRPTILDIASKLIAVRLESVQLRKLDAIVQLTGWNQSEVIRQLIDSAQVTPAHIVAMIAPKESEPA